MKKTKVGLVQPNFPVGHKKENAYYLPYSVGVLWSYANTFDDIRQKFTLTDIIFKRDNIESTAQKLANNDIVAFSTYVWNKNYNYSLAKRIKEINSNVFIVFGGPELPITKDNLFETHPYIDIVVMYEGEATFVDVLRTYDKPDVLYGVPGIYSPYSKNNRERFTDFNANSSPYLNGFFDKLMTDNPDTKWIATLETNRGCPYACTFCDWGSLTLSKIKKFELQRVLDEVQWISNNKCVGLFIADANFGAFTNRDEIILDRIIDVTKTNGYPNFFSLNWAKNQKKYVVDMAKKWIDAKIRAPALTISLQSLNETVLNNIKRSNMDINKIEELFKLCELKQVPVITDLILGLPGETIHSWKENYYKLFEAGNHHGIQVHQSQLLENAEMNLEQKGKFNIETVTTYDYMINSDNEECPEGVDIVISTNTMNKEHMVEAILFNWFIYTTHVSGTTSIIARFLRKYLNLSYSDFYSDLYTYFFNNKFFSDEMNRIKHYANEWIEKGTISHPDICNNKVDGYTLIRSSKMLWYSENKMDEYMAHIRQFLSTYNLPNTLESNLFHYQNYKVVDYKFIKYYPTIATFDYDIMGYLLNDSALENTHNVQICYPEDEDTNITLEKFISQLYYGRTREFGITDIVKLDYEY